jgi:hypothetical protein
MGNPYNRHDSEASCAFRPLSHPTGNASTDSCTNGERCAHFQPLFRCEMFDSPENKHLNGRDLAAHLEEVQQLALQRGQESGREEARRMAQASLLPHLKAMVDGISTMIAQVQLVEEHTSADAVSLALAIVEQVIGKPASLYDFGELTIALRKTLAQTNRYHIRMNPDDLRYLQELMRNDQLAWPDHPCIDVQTDPVLDRGHFQVALQNDQRDTLDRQVDEHISSFLSANTHQAA